MESQEQVSVMATAPVEPMLTVSASVDQNSAGAWRGKVSVSVSGPIGFRSSIYAGTSGEKYEQPEYTEETFALLPDEGDDELVNINAAHATEMNIRAVVQRVLSDMVVYVEGTAAALNAGGASEKKGK